MGCDITKIGDVTAVICTRGRSDKPQKCMACDKPSVALCDFPVGNQALQSRSGRTCSMPMCEDHRTVIRKGHDYCPIHAKLLQEKLPWEK